MIKVDVHAIDHNAVMAELCRLMPVSGRDSLAKTSLVMSIPAQLYAEWEALSRYLIDVKGYPPEMVEGPSHFRGWKLEVTSETM